MVRALSRSIGADYDTGEPVKLKRQLEQRDRDVDAELRKGTARFGTVLYPAVDGSLYEGTLHVFKSFGSGTRTMKLPKSVAALAGHELAVIKVSALGTLRINAAGGDTVDGSTSATLTDDCARTLTCDGIGGWYSGPEGPPGPTGPTGATGPAGANGSTVPIVYNATTSITVTTTHVGSALQTTSGSAISALFDTGLADNETGIIEQNGTGQITFTSAGGRTIRSEGTALKSSGRYCQIYWRTETGGLVSICGGLIV